MKINVGQLRKIIREVLNEQGWVPGRWMPGGEPIDDEDLEKMGHGGFLDSTIEEEEEET